MTAFLYQRSSITFEVYPARKRGSAVTPRCGCSVCAVVPMIPRSRAGSTYNRPHMRRARFQLIEHDIDRRGIEWHSARDRRRQVEAERHQLDQLLARVVGAADNVALFRQHVFVRIEREVA